MSEWIPVSERLPPEETRVLAYDGDKVFESEYWNGNWEWCADVTHWMPLPEPPEVKCWPTFLPTTVSGEPSKKTASERTATTAICGHAMSGA